MVRKSNDGTYLQDKLAEVLKAYAMDNKGFQHRFPDTKSARGNFLSAQPGDFMLLVPDHCLLIECKSTVSGANVVELAHHGDVGKRQIAKHRLWQRAGHPSLYLFGDLTAGKRNAVFEWHDGAAIINKVRDPLVSGRMADLGKSLPIIIKVIERKHYANVT